MCHHSGFKKVSSENNKRGRSKNTECKAQIDIKIKLTTRDTQKKDKFVKVSVWYNTYSSNRYVSILFNVVYK